MGDRRVAMRALREAGAPHNEDRQLAASAARRRVCSRAQHFCFHRLPVGDQCLQWKTRTGLMAVWVESHVRFLLSVPKLFESNPTHETYDYGPHVDET